MARPEGFEPPIFRIGICCVIQLRHERNYSAAKSGVVCGMLMANPNSMLIKAETMRECIFQYHIGVRTFDGPFLSPFGWFERRIAAKDFERGKYYRLEQIPPSASTLELLCTNLRQYGMGVEVRDAFHTQPIIVTFPENRYENCYLYGCVVHNSDSKLYLGVSKSNVESLLPEQITDIIGACDCASGIFYPFDHSWDASFRLSANGSATPWMKLDGLPSESNVTPCLRLQQPTSALELMYYSRLDGVERRQTISLYPQAGETPIQSWADVFCYDGNSRDGVFRLSVADNDGILMNREIWMNL